jgi:hypothetical protein
VITNPKNDKLIIKFLSSAICFLKYTSREIQGGLQVSKNQILEGKISWECGNTWKLSIQFKNDFLSHLVVQKINTYIAKQFSHVEFPYFVMGSLLG